MVSGRYDMVAIGAGMSGVNAADQAARRGAKVTVVEGGPLGGT